MNLPTRRLFIGLLPDDAVRAAIVDHQRRWYWGAGWPTRPARLHLTLHFLDEVDTAREQALRDTLAGAALAPFELTLRTAECWSGGITVWRPDDNPMLDDLHASLAKRLLQVGIAPHRADFKPHVTLARRAPNAAPPEAAPPAGWTVREFALVWSLKQPTARYEVLGRYGTA